MTGVFAAAVEVQQLFRKKRWRFCIIGGLAVIRWGEPRATRDVDISVLVPLGNEKKVIDAILAELEPRIPDAREFALQHRVLLCNASNDVEVDIALAGSGYEERVFDRASSFKFAPKCDLITASADDLVVLKAISDRDRDWVDLTGILIRQEGRLDWDNIVKELAQLCELKEDSSPMDRLETLRRKLAKDADKGKKQRRKKSGPKD